MTDDNAPGDKQSGYQRPPSDGRFKPGVSGNPRGRPKGARNLRTDVAALMGKKIPIRENGKARRISRQQAMLLRLYEKALQGDVRAATSFFTMIIKLDPNAGSENLVREAISENDKEIIADFLDRNKP
jgi:hypothetical protein